MSEAHSEQKRMGTIMQVLAWVSFMGLLAFFFSDVLEGQRNPNRDVATSVTGDGIREVQLERNRMGHYVATGTINGEPVVFLLDTGATGVAVPGALAARLGLERGRPLLARTANGTSRSFATLLGEVGLGEIRMRDVEATIAPGLQMEEVLLGMSFLKHLEFTQRGRTLTIRQYPPGR